MSWDDFVQSLTYDPEEMDQESWLQYLEQLEWLHRHPMDINSATPEEMARLAFLTPMQVEAIQAYVHLDGPMKSLGELTLVYGIDYETGRMLHLFFTVGDGSVAKAKRKGIGEWFGDMHNSVDSRLDIPLYYRRGYQTGKYRGNPLYSRMRYALESDHVRAGVHVEKDPGERFPDSYGGYAVIRDRGVLDNLVVGDYRVGWGEGLVMGRGFYVSKAGFVTSTSQGVRPMTSTSEADFLRGVALTLASPRRRFSGSDSRFRMSGTALFSYRTLDATLNKEGEAQTLVDDGYHRTGTEYAKRNNTHTLLAGAHLQASWRRFVVGATGYWQHFYRVLSPGSQLYRKWYPRGRDFGVAGVHGAYEGYRWTASGEVAYSTCFGGFAALGKVQWLVSRNLKFGALGRYYDHRYHSFQASAVGENSQVQNETGLMVRMDSHPFRWLTLVAWGDFFADYWPRYGMTVSSRGQEAMLEGTFDLAMKHQMSIRYQYKRKASRDVYLPHHKVKAQWTWRPSNDWRLQSTAMLHLAPERAPGFAVSQLLYGSFFPERAFRFSLMGGYFRVPDYDTRVYVYEPALWSSSTMFSTYSGEGVRLAATFRYTFPHSHWMVETKYSLTHMLDRDHISSGLQEILSPTRQDISVQVRMEY